MSKVSFLIATTLLLNAGYAWSTGNSAEDAINIVVNRSPTCSCCAKWVEHLQNNNFKVEDIVTNDVQSIKDKNGITKDLASCHTALVNGYVVEGHVPADDIKKLLKEKPDVIGIAVPQMPSGTPGMEMGGRKDPYQVISFDKNKQHHVFSDHKAD
ncbi:hypothetical protein MCAMS1_01841 [biofilm metagenome]